jgi:hypothetical protein
MPLKKFIKEWIDGIPDEKLMGFGDNTHTIYKDDNLRFDMEGVSGFCYIIE